MSGHSGHGLSASRSLGGSAMISSWCTEAAPWRCAVPRQSAPVSPPPMMTTRLPLALMGDAASAPSCTRLEGFRYSRARWTPSSSRPGTGRSRGSVAPPASTTASKAARTSAAGRTVTSGAQAVPIPRSSPGSTARRPRRARRAGTDRGGAHEGDPLGLHLGQPAVEDGLLHLELGDAVAQQPAGLLGPLEDGHPVARPGQLLGRRQAGRARAHDGHRLAGAHRRQLRGHPSLVPGPLDDLVLDPLDGDRVLVDPEHAGGLAGGRAEAPGELGEVVGGVQALHGVGPVVPVDQVVPLRDQVAERAAVVAEGDAAVHATGALLLGGLLAEGLVDLPPVAQPDRHRAAAGQPPRELHEAGRLTHVRPP